MSSINDLGKLIRTLRKRKGMTQAELANRSRTTQKSISRIETGKDNASFNTVINIFEALEVELALKEANDELVMLTEWAQEKEMEIN